MTTEKTKDKKETTGCADFGCNPAKFEQMFKMMDKCGPGHGVQSNCMEKMKTMMKNCCGTVSGAETKDSGLL